MEATTTRPQLNAKAMARVKRIAAGIAAKIPPCLFDRDDLEQEGMLAMLAALARGSFDPDRASQSTYADSRAWGAMLDALRVSAPAGRASLRREKVGGPPAPRTVTASGYMRGHEGTFDETAGSWRTRWDFAHHDPAPTDGAEVELVAACKRIGGPMTANERRVIGLYYCRGLSMKEIGRELGVSESRVSQMHTQIIGRLAAGAGAAGGEAAVRAMLLG